MSPRSRSVDSRQPQNNLILARNCLAITFIRDPNCSQLTGSSSLSKSSSCKRCSGLNYIDDNVHESGESFDEKTISEDAICITASSSSSSSHESSPFTSLSSSSTSSSSSPPQQQLNQNETEQISTINTTNCDNNKTNCSSLLSTTSDLSSSPISSLTSSLSPPCTCPVQSNSTATPAPPSSSSIDFSGLELFTSFVEANYRCFWNPSLVSSVSSLNYRGFLLPATIIMIGSEYAYEVIRTAYARRIIRPPTGYLIQSLGDVPLVEMSLVGQTKFTPLTEALCKCINEFNQQSVNCFLGEINDSIRSSYPNITPPTVEMIKKTLRSLQREGKVRFSASDGYCLIQPSMGSEVNSSSSVILGGGNGAGDNSIEPISPSSTIKRESARLYSSLMTPDEVISRLHGSPTSSAESAYYGSTNGAGGVISDNQSNLITPTESLDVTVNWDCGIDNQAMLLGGKDDASDIISLRRSSSLRIPSMSKATINRTQENGCNSTGGGRVGAVDYYNTSTKLVSNLSTTSSTTLTSGGGGGPFSRSKSLRMVNHHKEKINAHKSMTIDSSETSSKTDAINVTIKKPSLFTKFLARLSYNGGGNGLTTIGPKSLRNDQQLNQRKLATGDWNDESNNISQSSQETKSTQTTTTTTTSVNNKSSSLTVLQRNRSNKCYCTNGKLSSINCGYETTTINTNLIRKSSTLDNNSRQIKCKPYGNPTSCIYCETLRTISTGKTKRSNQHNYNNHSPLAQSNQGACDLCNLINSPTSSLTPTGQQSTVIPPSSITNGYPNGIGSPSYPYQPAIGPIVDPNCDKCLTSLTYCCTNIDCGNVTSSSIGSAVTSSRLYSSHFHHHPGQHNHHHHPGHQPSSLLHQHQHLSSQQQQQQPPITDQFNHHHHHQQQSTSSSFLSRQCATLSSSTPSSSSPPPSPYSRFTLSPTLRSTKSSATGGHFFSSSRLTPSSSLAHSPSTPYSPSSPLSSSTINNPEKLSPITIQTNSSELTDRLTNGLSGKSSSLLRPTQLPQKNLMTTVNELTIGDVNKNRSMVVIKSPLNESTINTTTVTTTTPSIITSTATKIEPISMKMTKELTNDSLWNEIGGKQLEAELRETGITIGNSFNFKIEIASPTNQQSDSSSTTKTTTTTSTTTKTLLSNDLVKSFTNFEEKSADNLPKDLSSLLSSKSISNQYNRPSSSLLLSPTTNLTSVTNCTSTINVCTVNSTNDNKTSTINKQEINDKISTTTSSSNANNDYPSSSSSSSSGITTNQQFNSSESINENEETEMNGPTSISIMTTTKLSNGTTECKSDSPTTDQNQQTDSLTNGLIKTPTTISDLRQKVAQAKAAFFNSSSAGGESTKITSTC